jgi:hypothetical protein
METIIHSPLQIRRLSDDSFYFAQSKLSAKPYTVVVYLSKVYKAGSNTENTVLLFGSPAGSDEILWLSENGFYDFYDVIGKVNRMIFE